MSNDKPVTLFTDGALDMQKVDTLLSLGLQKAIEHLKQAVVGFQQELGEKYPHPTERLVLMDAFAQAARLCAEGTEIALNELGEKYPHPTERLVLMDAFAQAARLCVEGTEIALNERS